MKLTNEEVQEIVARADDEYDRLKDRVHEQYDEIERLKEGNKDLKLSNIYLSKTCDKYKMELERLHNIINEIEVFLKEGTELATGCGITKEYIYAYENALYKLQELKGVDKE